MHLILKSVSYVDRMVLFETDTKEEIRVSFDLIKDVYKYITKEWEWDRFANIHKYTTKGWD